MKRRNGCMKAELLTEEIVMAPPPVIRLHPEDNVVIARATLLPGAPVGDNVLATQRIPAGHKVAVRGDRARRRDPALWADHRFCLRRHLAG